MPQKKEKKAAPSGRDLMTPQQKKDADIAAVKAKADAKAAGTTGGDAAGGKNAGGTKKK